MSDYEDIKNAFENPQDILANSSEEEILQALENLIDMGLADCFENEDGEVVYQITDLGAEFVQSMREAIYQVN